jgi:hypothetical protein
MADVLRGLRFEVHPSEPRPGTVTPELSAADAAFLDRYAGRELARFGYPRTDAALTGRERLGFGLATGPVNRMAMVAWRAFGARTTTAVGC